MKDRQISGPLAKPAHEYKLDILWSWFDARSPSSESSSVE